MKLQPTNFIYNKTSLAFNAQKASFLKRRTKNNENHVVQRENPSRSDVARYAFIKLMDAQNEYFKSFVTKKGKLTKEEYGEIRDKHPYIISRSYQICENRSELNPISTPKILANAAKTLKIYYDKKYGKDGYKILSIGTSPSPITEAMQLLDCEVIFAPITKLRDSINKKPMAKQYSNISTLMRYCTKKGLAKDKNKKIIVLDYSYTGESLRTMKRILLERGDIKEEQIKLHSIINDLRTCSENKDYSWVSGEDVFKIEMDMTESKMMNMSNVPHFYMDENKAKEDEIWTIYSKYKINSEIFDDFDNHSTPTGRAWALCIAHELLKWTHPLF